MPRLPAYEQLQRERAERRAKRTLGEALADHGIMYIRHDCPRSGRIMIALHSAKGWLGYYRAPEAWELVETMESAST